MFHQLCFETIGDLYALANRERVVDCDPSLRVQAMSEPARTRFQHFAYSGHVLANMTHFRDDVRFDTVEQSRTPRLPTARRLPLSSPR